MALSMLGYSALLQRQPDLADRFFEEAVGVDVPDRTVSVNKPIEARAAFRRGNQSAAYRILRDYVDQLMETDYPDLATNAAVEFINMMAAIDRLLAAARVLGYLRAAGDFGALAGRTLVADAAARIADGLIPDHDGSPEPEFDARHALMYMRDVLDGLIAMGTNSSLPGDSATGPQSFAGRGRTIEDDREPVRATTVPTVARTLGRSPQPGGR